MRKYRRDNGLSFGEVARTFAVSLERLCLLESVRATPAFREGRRFERLLCKQKIALKQGGLRKNIVNERARAFPCSFCLTNKLLYAF